MKSALALWLLLASLALGADTPNAEEPVKDPGNNTVQAEPAQPQPERKSRKRSQASRQDVVRIGASAELKTNESCNDFVVVGGSAQIDGQVYGDLVVIGSSAKLGPAAVVRGDTVAVGSLLDTDPGATIRGERVMIGSLEGWSEKSWLRWPMEWVSKGLFWGRPLPHQFAWSWAVAGVFLLLNVGIGLLFPRPVRTCVQMLENQPGGSFLAGLLAFGLFLPVLLLLAVSVIGLIVVPLVIVAFFAAFFLGKVVVYSYAGQQVGEQLGVGALKQPLLALVIGTLLFYVFYAVPVLGFVVWGAAATLAVGSVTLTAMRSFRSSSSSSQNAGLAGGSAVPVALGTGSMGGAGPAAEQPNVLLLPRVGFWLRFLATLIDATLVAVVVGRLLHAPKALILVWVGYHLAMWAWKGTTIGGLVFGLKIVRTDGHRIDFGVALVRALSAFLSAAVLFLGFFWAGWTQESQSWHDKIAGTVVVKLPKGVSPLQAA